MKIDNEFTVHVPVDRAWEVFNDPQTLAPLLPGAELTGSDGDNYSGIIKIKVGPVLAQYKGTVHYVEQDAGNHHAVVEAKGRETRGSGTASATAEVSMQADGDATAVKVSTDLSITGKIAQFGAGMIKEVSEKLLAQFVKNFEAQLLGEPIPEAGPPAARTAAGPSAPHSSGSESSTTERSAPDASNRESPARESVASEPSTGAPRQQPANEPLDLMDLAGGSLIKRFLPIGAAVAIGTLVLIILRAVRNQGRIATAQEKIAAELSRLNR